MGSTAGPRKHGRIGHIFIELTNVCNFDCTFCPNEIMTRKRGFMPAQMATSLIDQIAEAGLTRSLMFHLMGEPMLHGDWYQVFEHAIRRDLAVTFGTNCSRMDAATLEKLFSLPITSMILSLQTPTPDTYTLRRAGNLGFDEFVARVKATVRKKFEARSDVLLSVHLLNTCSFVRNLIDLRRDIRVLEDDEAARRAVAVWIGFAREVIREFGLDFSPPSDEEVGLLSLRKGFVFEILPDVNLISRRATNWINTMTNRKRLVPGIVGGCAALTGQCGILWNGDFVLCCGDFDGNTVIGNVERSSLVEILDGPRAKMIRRAFSVGLLAHPYCRRCRGGTTLRSYVARQVGTLATHTLRLYRWGDQDLVLSPRHSKRSASGAPAEQATLPG